MSEGDTIARDLWVERVLHYRIPERGASGGLAAWKAARGQAVVALKALEEAIRKGGDPDGDAAVILLRAVRANLTEEPATARQIEELRGWLSSDDIVAAAETPNVYGVTIHLREPLLAALASIPPA